MFQELILAGNLGNDPELRKTPQDIPVCTFSLAVNKSWTDANGAKQDKTTWFRVTTWRKQAETVHQYLKKGAKVLVTGEVEGRAYLSKSGEPAFSLEVNANAVRFLSSKNEANGDAPASNTKPPADTTTPDEDIPF